MMNPSLRSLHEANRMSWNAAVVAHNSHKGDQIAYFKGGGSTLFPEESRLLSPLSGAHLLHLQCNCGQDSLSLAQLGARVTAVDISDSAIDFARAMSLRTGIPLDLHRADIYDFMPKAHRAGQMWDLVFSSYGALTWLSNLDTWARAIANVLRCRGRFVMVDFHPLVQLFNEQGQLTTVPQDRGTPIPNQAGVPDYVGWSGAGLWPWGFQEGIRNFQNPYPHHEFHWSIGDVMSALLGAGLNLRSYEEFPYSNGCRLFDDSRADANRRIYPPEHLVGLPMMFALRADKG